MPIHLQSLLIVAQESWIILFLLLICSDNDPNITGLLLIPHPWHCWSSYHYVILYIFGACHIVLSVWMIVEYFFSKKPNLIFRAPAFMNIPT